MQYGSSSIKIQGPDGSVVDIDKDEIRRRFKLRATGTLFNSSPSQNENKAIQRLQLYANNPNVNQAELVRQALLADDERLAEILFVPVGESQQNQIERQIQEIGFMARGYTSIPKLSDDDQTHIQVIDDFLQDPKKNRSFPEDRIEVLMNHRKAHILALEKKKRATSKGGRLQQEIANTARGFSGRQARQAIPEISQGVQ